MAVLSVRNRISRCDVVELGEELFGARLCTGTVEAILQRAARALEDPMGTWQSRCAPARA